MRLAVPEGAAWLAVRDLTACPRRVVRNPEGCLSYVSFVGVARKYKNDVIPRILKPSRNGAMKAAFTSGRASSVISTRGWDRS